MGRLDAEQITVTTFGFIGSPGGTIRAMNTTSKTSKTQLTRAILASLNKSLDEGSFDGLYALHRQVMNLAEEMFETTYTRVVEAAGQAEAGRPSPFIGALVLINAAAERYEELESCRKQALRHLSKIEAGHALEKEEQERVAKFISLYFDVMRLSASASAELVRVTKDVSPGENTPSAEGTPTKTD